MAGTVFLWLVVNQHIPWFYTLIEIAVDELITLFLNL